MLSFSVKEFLTKKQKAKSKTATRIVLPGLNGLKNLVCHTNISRETSVCSKKRRSARLFFNLISSLLIYMTVDFNCWRMYLNEYYRLLAENENSSINQALFSLTNVFCFDGPKRSTIRRWVIAFEEHGDIGPKRERIEKPWSRVEPLHLDLARNLFHHHPTAYYQEICFAIFTAYGRLYSRQSLCDALHNVGFTRKVFIFIITKNNKYNNYDDYYN